jgi:hypothetical protein
MRRLEVQLSLERDRTQPPYRAVDRASRSGLKDKLVMVYRLESNSLSLIDEEGHLPPYLEMAQQGHWAIVVM